MKRTQCERLEAQATKIKAAIDFDELGALHDELCAQGLPTAAREIVAACEKLDAALRALTTLAGTK